jgi:hypothetical protein
MPASIGRLYPSLGREIAVGYADLVAFGAGEDGMAFFAMMGGMPVEDVGERCKLRGRCLAHPRCGRWREDFRGRQAERSRSQCVLELAEALRLAQQPFWKADAEGLLDPEEELGAGQAVEAPVAVERSVEVGVARRPLRIELPVKLVRDRDKRFAWGRRRRTLGRLSNRIGRGRFVSV